MFGRILSYLEEILVLEISTKQIVRKTSYNQQVPRGSVGHTLGPV